MEEADEAGRARRCAAPSSSTRRSRSTSASARTGWPRSRAAAALARPPCGRPSVARASSGRRRPSSTRAGSCRCPSGAARARIPELAPELGARLAELAQAAARRELLAPEPGCPTRQEVPLLPASRDPVAVDVARARPGPPAWPPGLRRPRSPCLPHRSSLELHSGTRRGARITAAASSGSDVRGRPLLSPASPSRRCRSRRARRGGAAAGRRCRRRRTAVAG